MSAAGEGLTVPAGEGRAVDVPAGRTIRITTPHGGQAADFFAFVADDVSEWLSAAHTWTWTRRMRPYEGQEFLSLRRRPLVRFVEDGAGGTHDMFIAACDQARYAQLGFEGPHRSCSENLIGAMAARGVAVTVVPQPINFFTSTEVDAGQRLINRPNPVPPGGYVRLEALVDLVCVVSSCPYDLALPDWPINSAEGVTELTVTIG